MAEQIKMRVLNAVKTSEEWAEETAAIKKGILCIEITSDGKMKAKAGDGTKTYSELPYLNAEDLSGYAKAADLSSTDVRLTNALNMLNSSKPNTSELHGCAFSGIADGVSHSLTDTAASHSPYYLLGKRLDTGDKVYRSGDGANGDNTYIYGGRLYNGGQKVVRQDDIIYGRSSNSISSASSMVSVTLSLPFTATENTIVTASVHRVGTPAPYLNYCLTLNYYSGKIYAVICAGQNSSSSLSATLPAGTYYVDWLVLDKGE
ncbi:hypothetical protein Osc1_02830 [Hominimerdicola sp. 21CYCFAH17_S]